MEIKSGEEGERERLLSELGKAKALKAGVDENIGKLVESGQSITSSHKGMNLATQRRFANEAISEIQAELSNLG